MLTLYLILSLILSHLPQSPMRITGCMPWLNSLACLFRLIMFNLATLFGSPPSNTNTTKIRTWDVFFLNIFNGCNSMCFLQIFASHLYSYYSLPIFSAVPKHTRGSICFWLQLNCKQHVLPCILKKNHDRFKFSYGVPAQSGLVHRLNSTWQPSLFCSVPRSKNKDKTI